MAICKSRPGLLTSAMFWLKIAVYQAFIKYHLIIILSIASIAQLVECSLGKAEVTGSIPVGSSNVKVIILTYIITFIFIAFFIDFSFRWLYHSSIFFGRMLE